MLFNSLGFLFLFLPIVYFGFWRLRTKNQRYIWLTIAGYIFYGTWNYKFCALMAFSTAVSYFAGLGLLVTTNPRRRKLFLILPVTADLLLLGFFKYFNFTLISFAAVASWFHFPFHPPALSIILPVGISFYTFHTISYMVDAYRGVITPTRNFWEFSCYVSLFSQLVAGPIVRFRQVEADLDDLDRASRTRWLDIGWSFFAIGMMKKVLIADTIAAVIAPAWKDAAHFSTATAWLCVLGYTYQIYFDFSGYSDMAVGLGYLFGIRLPQNFNSPYKALNIADFWRRWHISLSSCLRDYLYIPLGGSRGSAPWLAYRNLLITMLLGGLWHGANWTFVFWGGYHGVLLCLYRLFREEWDGLPASLQRTATFFLVLLGWVVFRADNFGVAAIVLTRMFSWSSGFALPGLVGLLSALVIAGPIAHFAPNTFEMKHEWRPWAVAAIVIGYAAALFSIAGGQPSPFLYFQF
ncbi:MAG TPA: MBOAT family O-acyltransferase [Candidatus Acidoferrum sp.]|nr:MBOAT family O-acyltransferase [Candidatus Acidoferrum sp.]